MRSRGFPSGSAVKNPPAMQEMQESRVRSLGRKLLWRRAQPHTPYPCLEKPMDRGAWRATVHRVAKRQTWLKRLSTHTQVRSRLWECLRALKESFSSLNHQGPSFTKGVRLLWGKMNHHGKVPLSGFGWTSIASFLFTHSERRSECCSSTFTKLEMYFRMDFQVPLYCFLLSLVRDDEMTNSWEALESLSRTMVE